MTKDDLRTAISDELRDLPPMRTVLPQVLAEGQRDVLRRSRRRRWATVGLATAAVVGIASVAPIAFDQDAETPSLRATDGESDRTSLEVATPAGPVTDTKPEFTAWAADQLSELLPERFSRVRPAGTFDFVTRTAGTRVEFNLNITKVDWENSDIDPGEIDLAPSCGEVDGGSCAELPSKHAIAHHETTDDEFPYAGMEMYLDGQSKAADHVALNFFGPRNSDEPVPLTNQEILDLVASPRFERIWREYTAHPEWVYGSTFTTLDEPKSK